MRCQLSCIHSQVSLSITSEQSCSPGSCQGLPVEPTAFKPSTLDPTDLQDALKLSCQQRDALAGGLDEYMSTMTPLLLKQQKRVSDHQVVLSHLPAILEHLLLTNMCIAFEICA